MNIVFTCCLAVASSAVAAEPVALPADVAGRCEVWLCAGQSNMQQGWGFYESTAEERVRVARELAQLDEVDIRFWDFNDRSWTKLCSRSSLAREKCANGISFAIRRAKRTKKPVCILYVAAGGAPTEAFLSRKLMCALDKDGRPRYPRLRKIALNPNSLDANDDFPCLWCKSEYPRRKGKAAEAAWWPVSRMYEEGVRLVEHLPLAGIYWYQGESNATRNVAPDEPLSDDYMLETNLAVIEQLRGNRSIPFVMMGLPKMNRPWGPYRAAQRRACERLGAIYVDSFAAGLGDERNVHPRDKIPFAELVIRMLESNPYPYPLKPKT